MIFSRSFRATCAPLLGTSLLGGGHAVAAETGEVRPDETRLQITGTGSLKAAPDQVTATLQVQSEAPKAVTAQGQTNKLAQTAMAAAEKINGITTSSEDYQVFENRVNNKPGTWTASQTISVRGTDAAAVLELVGRLQGLGLLLNNIAWSLSPDHQKQLESQAEQLAIRDMQARASTIASTLNMQVGQIQSLSVNEGFTSRPTPFMMRAATLSAPVMKPDDQTVNATVRATLLLRH
jgi:uncharacterized protein YggE